MADEPTTEAPPKGKKSSGKFHGVPKPVLFAGVGIVAYLGYRWWKNKQSSSSSTTTPSATTAGTTTGATDTSGSGMGGGFGGGYGGGQATTPTINPDTGLPYLPTTTIDPSTGLANTPPTTPPTAIIYPNEPAPAPGQVVPPGSTIPVKTTPTGLPALAAFGAANPTGVNAQTGANKAAAPKGSSKQVLGETVKNVS